MYVYGCGFVVELLCNGHLGTITVLACYLVIQYIPNLLYLS